jgi:DNA-binding NarL/FixJ family response regulator
MARANRLTHQNIFMERTMANLVIVKNIMDLKPVEQRIVSGITAGFTNKEIAKNMGLKTGTVNNYISCILHKTGLQHRTQIAIFALQVGNRSDTVNDQ